jgi:ligand-binding sensor domain-containing protein
MKSILKYNCKLWCFILFVFLFSSEVKAQFTIYNTQNSLLPDNSIRCIATSYDSTLWIGTDYGLAHFNNGTFTVYQTNNANLPDDYIRCLNVANDSTIWIGTFLNGFSKFKNNVFENYNSTNSSLPSNFVRCIAFDTLGNAWLGTLNGLTYVADTGFVIFNTENTPLFSANITSLYIDRNNVKWLGTLNGGLIEYDDTNWTTYNNNNSSLPDNTIVDIKEDSNGILWLSTPSAGIVQFNRTSWNFLTPLNSPLPDYSINQIVLNENNVAYIATKESGLAKYAGNLQWSLYNESNSNISGDNLTCVAIDLHKNIWLGTAQQGLMMLDETITSLSALENHFHISVYPNPVNDFITLNTNNNEKAIQHTYIYSIDGKLLQQKQHDPTPCTTINTSSLYQGVFLLEIKTIDGNASIQKIIKH